MKTLADVIREFPGDFESQARVLRESVSALRLDLARLEGALWAIEAQISSPVDESTGETVQ